MILFEELHEALVALIGDSRTEVIERVSRWMNDAPEDSELIAQMVHAGHDAELIDCFWRDLPFGTAGRRGHVGPGPNRMNPRTVATAIQGHCDYLRATQKGHLSVFVAWDGRCFQNLKGRLPGDGGVLHGLTSRALGQLAAQVYSANDVDVHLFHPDETPAVATPELAYHVRRRRLQGGVVISASHNHPDDNGCKVFDELGGQAVPPDDERLIEAMSAVADVRQYSWQEALESGRLHFLDETDLNAYLDTNCAILPDDNKRSARIVFTNLNGVGDRTAGAALERAGFEVHYVPEQRPLDGAFSGVPMAVANPEVPQALDAAVERARELDADIVLATDPDADRIGACVPNGNGSWIFLTGNQILSLVAAWRADQDLPAQPVAVTTEVTTRMFRRIWEAAGAQVIDRQLVGCKYIANVIRSLEDGGSFSHGGQEARGNVASFVMGCEEAHGIVLTADIRDKDGATPALVLAHMAATMAAVGSTVWDLYLSRVIAQHGGIWNVQVPLIFDGPDGAQRMTDLVDALRRDSPQQIAGRQVAEQVDRLDERGIDGPYLSDSDRRGRNLLVWELHGGDRVVVRPSGTEPKLKIYVETWVGNPQHGGPNDIETAVEWLNDARAAATLVAREFTAHALRGIGIELSDAALALDPLVSVEERITFEKEVVQVIARFRRRGEEVQAEATWARWYEGLGSRRQLAGDAAKILGIGTEDAGKG